MALVPVSVTARLYRFFLRLYPKEFRDSYGRAMVDTFTLRAQERGSKAGAGTGIWFLIREFAGLVLTAVSLRISAIIKRRHRRPRRTQASTERRTEKEHMSHLAREIRYATRRLIKSPGFTIAAVVTLGLGIGANSAIFSVVHGVVLSPLPYPEPDRLVWLDHSAAGINVDKGLDMTAGLYVHYRGQSQTLDEVAIYDVLETSLTGEPDPERVETVRVTHTLLEVLRVPPALGRWFDEGDTYVDGTGVVVLSHGLWSRRFGADPGILGRTIQLNGVTFEVIGIAPPSLAFPDPRTQLWIPLVVNPARQRLGGFTVRGIARLKPQFSAADAQADLDALIPRLPEAFPDGGGGRAVVEDAKLRARVVPLKEHLVADIRPTLWILLGTVGFVLLIACANVANLFLVRADSRHREVAVRRALGASRGQLLRHFLSESTLLVMVGGVLGLALAFAAVRLVVGLGPENLPRLHEVEINGIVLGFTAVISIVASLAFGAIPSLRRAPDMVASLKEGGRGTTTGRARFRARNVLVTSQIALALILLIGAGLMVRSYWHLRSVHPGFDTESVLTFDLGLAVSDYPDRESAVAFHQELLDRLEALPGVVSAGAVTCLPLCGNWAGNPLEVEGSPRQPGVIPPVVATRRVSPGYPETMKIPLLAGRTIERADQDGRSGAALVNAELVKRYWPGEDPIGRRVYHSSDPTDSTWYTVVGVVGNVPVGKLTDDPNPAIYLPLLHSDGSRGPSPHSLSFVVRTSTPPLGLAAAVRSEIWSMNPNLPIAHLRTMERVVADAGIQMAFTMVLLVIAAAVALLLGAVGIYGVVSYVVSQRTSEIGVRIALGARGEDVSRMVLKQGGAAAAIGLTLGLAGSFALTRLMSALLYDVSPTDPATFAAVATLLLAVTLLATYLPARRAARIDPMEALRSE